MLKDEHAPWLTRGKRARKTRYIDVEQEAPYDMPCVTVKAPNE